MHIYINIVYFSNSEQGPYNNLIESMGCIMNNNLYGFEMKLHRLYFLR